MGGDNGLGAAWNRRTNQRAVENITQLVVELCHQMEGWRRLLRQLERLERERDPANQPLISRPAPGPPRAANRRPATAPAP